MSGRNVLIVEDEAGLAYTFAALLRPLAGKVRIAEDWASAQLTLKEPNGFDLVLLDLNLPDSRVALTIARIPEIRAGGRRVVVISGALLPGLEAEAKARGADGCLYKGDIRLTEKIRGYLSNPAPSFEAPKTNTEEAGAGAI